jgi:Carboxypeptidase regulatory-like domain
MVDAMRAQSFVALAALLSCIGYASAQVIEGRQVDGRSVWYSHTGIFSDLKDCAGKADWYAYVFVGSIAEIAPADKDEKILQIIPEEVFHGDPASPLSVLTSQAPCFPKMTVGDRWLFFLRQEKDKPIDLDYYGNDSLPLANAQQQIETLRNLKSVGDFGIVQGQVLERTPDNPTPVPHATVVAHLQYDERKFVATTGDDGRFEFQPLPPGSYKFTVDPIGSLRIESGAAGWLPLRSGGCWNLTLSHFPHAEIGGHVQHLNGSPLSNVEVIIFKAHSDSFYATMHTDQGGHFSINSLQPGEYIVGINPHVIPPDTGASGTGATVPTPSRYYRDEIDRSVALVIPLADGDKRDDIDFVIPDQ